MQILIPEVASPEGAAVADRLRAAGHDVRTCYGARDTGVECVALRHERCPVEDGDIDAAVIVAGGSPAHARAEAEGARCARRRRIPIVAVEADGSDVVAAVGNALTQPMPGHSEEALAALVDVLTRHGVDATGARAGVHRRDGRLRVRVETPDPLPLAVTRALAVRVPQRVRLYDPWAGGLDLLVAPAPSDERRAQREAPPGA